MKTWIVVLLTLTALACGERAPGTPDEQIGLSKVEITEIPSPALAPDNESEPGESPPVPRAFAESPPVIPHGIADFLPITREDNPCLACHTADGEKVAGEPPPLPATHRTDLRNDPSTVGEEVVGARYVCTSCHALQRDAAPLVGNRFAG